MSKTIYYPEMKHLRTTSALLFSPGVIYRRYIIDRCRGRSIVLLRRRVPFRGPHVRTRPGRQECVGDELRGIQSKGEARAVGEFVSLLEMDLALGACGPGARQTVRHRLELLLRSCVQPPGDAMYAALALLLGLLLT